MTTLSDSIAARVRELRLAKGWSQEQLAEEVNLSRDAISRIERGERSPRLETLFVIGKAVGLPLPKFLDFGEPAPRSRPGEERWRSLERSIDQMEPWLADAVMNAIRVISQAHVRANSRKKRRIVQGRRTLPARRFASASLPAPSGLIVLGRRKPPLRKSATHRPRRA